MINNHLSARINAIQGTGKGIISNNLLVTLLKKLSCNLKHDFLEASSTLLEFFPTGSQKIVVIAVLCKEVVIRLLNARQESNVTTLFAVI